MASPFPSYGYATDPYPGWSLLGYLLFFSQRFGSEIKSPPLLWVKQAIFLAMMVGVIYPNANRLAPNLLMRGRTGDVVF